MLPIAAPAASAPGERAASEGSDGFAAAMAAATLGLAAPGAPAPQPADTGSPGHGAIPTPLPTVSLGEAVAGALTGVGETGTSTGASPEETTTPAGDHHSSSSPDPEASSAAAAVPGPAAAEPDTVPLGAANPVRVHVVELGGEPANVTVPGQATESVHERAAGPVLRQAAPSAAAGSPGGEPLSDHPDPATVPAEGKPPPTPHGTTTAPAPDSSERVIAVAANDPRPSTPGPPETPSAPRPEPVPDVERADGSVAGSPASAEPVPVDGEPTTSTPTTTRPSLVHRIEEAIRRLEQGPPPRTITLDLDELGMGRLTVSAGSDGIRITPADGAAAPATLLAELREALSSRGFEMADRRDRQEADGQEDADRWQPGHRSPGRRAARAGLRL